MLLRALTTSLLILAGTVMAVEESTPLVKTKAYQEGLRALEDQLPELAIRRFETARIGASKKDEGIPALEVRLAEALVRAGRSKEALELLKNYPENDDARFWKGHALLAMGQLRESEEAFAQLSQTKDSRRRDLANMARARILASLRDDRELSVLFTALGKSSDERIVTQSQLLHATVLLDKELLDDCSQLLSVIKPEEPAQQRFFSFLKGQHALLQKDYAKAEDLLKPLTESTDHLSPALYQSTAFTYAEVLHLLEKNGPAVEFLLDFVSKNTDSIYLPACFLRLTDWSQDDEVLKEIVIQRLQSWSTPTTPVQPSPFEPAIISSSPSTNPLLPYSLYHRALLLSEENDQTAVAEAKSLLARLRLETPQSPLVANSLLETSRLHLAGQNKEASLSALAALENISSSPSLKAHAAELAARIEFDAKNFSAAAESFMRMKEHLSEGQSKSDILNSGVSLLLANETSDFKALTTSVDSKEVLTTLQLERTLLRASNLENSAKKELNAFLQHHGDHPRAAEARVALAELSLLNDPQDLNLTATMLREVNASTLPEPLALRHLLTQLKLAELTRTEEAWQNAIDGASSYLSSRPNAALKPAIRFKLAEAFYLNNDFSKSQLLFQQVANDKEAVAYHEVSLFFAARAAIKVTTPEARKEAIALFERVLKINGSLAGDARLKLAQAHLDAGNYDQALEMLSPLTKKSAENENIDALLLMAEALRAKGSDEGDQKALEIYSSCLSRKDLPYAKSNHIHYLKGLTQEKLGKPDDALDTLYRVVNRENLTKGAPITEWSFYYDCGSKAITLLLAKEEAVAAHALARKIARSGGPKSEDFAARAEDIQLKHMIMEE